MKLFIAIFFLISGFAYGQTNFRAIMVDTNGVVQRPTNTLTFTNIVSFGTNIVATVRTNLQLGGGVTTNKTFVSYDGTNYITNTVTLSNGIITGWTQ